MNLETDVTHLPKVLVFGASENRLASAVDGLRDQCQIVPATSLADALTRLREDNLQGVCVLGEKLSPSAFLLETGGLLEKIPDGIALLDLESNILWHNDRLAELAQQSASLVGQPLLDSFGTVEILGPDFCPFHTALGSNESTRTTIRVGDKNYFQVDATPVLEDLDEFPNYLLVMVRDLTSEVIQRQKLNAIYQAGLELGDLQPQEVLEMSVDERIDLLKSKILHFTQDLLEFDTVEIRLVERTNNRLTPLLAVGMEPDAESRELFADAEGNGVTGFVAATGRSYLCEDIDNDPLYLPGAPGARSSLTVPLVLHDEILGTFNVESPKPGAFTENDLQFLELFCREVAMALNTLDLLVAEKATTAQESTTLMLREVADPVDEILNDAAWILEKYIGHDAPVTERLQRILSHTREIRELIQKVGEAISPDLGRAGLSAREQSESQVLRAKRILVADSDKEVRRAAHELLGRYGCIVETAHNGEEALLMGRTFHYDAVIADIHLPDMNGAECFQRMREIHEHMPVILMTGFGYDPTHSIVKARQMGLKSVLYKPFRLDQLLGAVEEAACGQSASRPC
ncbi:Response regulator MprA [Maioricimonas rarisocia]|uniref:Response regulator MprA n=1 Tax=Maioricimonas rarisocia TaxID=2528026 RepID=A0A517ZBC4_9PLAN|nr:response regulator [Maioricimonas rarisocia]QDU39731.1 Response regulator MprA [Maioricimonas rarisocia]